MRQHNMDDFDPSTTRAWYTIQPEEFEDARERGKAFVELQDDMHDVAHASIGEASDANKHTFLDMMQEAESIIEQAVDGIELISLVRCMGHEEIVWNRTFARYVYGKIFDTRDKDKDQLWFTHLQSVMVKWANRTEDTGMMVESLESDYTTWLHMDETSRTHPSYRVKQAAYKETSAYFANEMSMSLQYRHRQGEDVFF